jgi:hypothetical protein
LVGWLFDSFVRCFVKLRESTCSRHFSVWQYFSFIRVLVVSLVKHWQETGQTQGIFLSDDVWEFYLSCLVSQAEKLINSAKHTA